MEKLDFFSINFQLNFKGHSSYSTNFSKTISFIFIIISVFAFIWNVAEMAQRKKLSINSYRSDITLDDQVVFNESSSFFCFSLVDKNLKLITKNSSLFEYITVGFTAIIDKKRLPLQLINSSQTLNKFVFTSSDFDIDTCVDFNNTLIYGNFYADFTRYFQLNVDFNQSLYAIKTNSTDDVIFYIYIYFPISAINLNNYQKPYNLSIGWNYFSINSNKNRSIYMPYEKIEIHTDNNFIGRNYQTEHFLSSKYSFSPDDSQDSPFQIFLFIDPIKTVYYRLYMNFQEVINNVNSVVNISSIIFKFCCGYFNKIKLRQSFIEEDMLFKKESKEDLYDMNINSIKQEMANKVENIEDNIQFNKDPQINDNSNKVQAVSKEDHLKPDLSDDLPCLINFLSCYCRKNRSNSENFALFKVYEYYESLSDARNLMINIHDIISSKNSKNRNFINKINGTKIVLKISRKNLKINSQCKSIATHDRLRI